MAYNSMVGRIRFLESTILAMFLLFSSSGLAFTHKTYLHTHRFILDYAVVQHCLKNDQGYLEELMEIDKKAPGAAVLIVDHWHHKAFTEDYKNIQIIVRLTLEVSASKKLDKKETDERLYDSTSLILEDYYYDHWDEINKMIIEKYQHLFPDKPIKKLSKP